jgi:hypothetical protein
MVFAVRHNRCVDWPESLLISSGAAICLQVQRTDTLTQQHAEANESRDHAIIRDESLDDIGIGALLGPRLGAKREMSFSTISPRTA